MYTQTKFRNVFDLKRGLTHSPAPDPTQPLRIVHDPLTFKGPVEKSTRSWSIGWVDPSPVAIDTKLSASLRVVLSPTKRKVYLEARCSIALLVIRA